MSRRERVVEAHGFRYIKLKTGRLLSFWDCLAQARSGRTTLATGISRAFATAPDDSHLEQLEWLLDDVESYLCYMRKQIEEHRGVETQRERIARLRNVAGREPGEAMLFLQKADELEAALVAEGER